MNVVLFVTLILNSSLIILSFLLSLNFLNSQVVGWPPLRAYRMNSFNNNQSKSLATDGFNSMVEKGKSNHTAIRKTTDNASNKTKNSAKEKGHIRGSLFVKVNMDGIPIGRKVDLSAHSSYESLALSLEDMFNESTPVVSCKGEIS